MTKFQYAGYDEDSKDLYAELREENDGNPVTLGNVEVQWEYKKQVHMGAWKNYEKFLEICGDFENNEIGLLNCPVYLRQFKIKRRRSIQAIKLCWI